MRTLIITVFVGLLWPAWLLAETPASLAARLQPFVDKHELAGAVAPVVDKD